MMNGAFRIKCCVVLWAVSLSVAAQDAFMSRMLDEVNTFTGSAPSITQTAGLFGKNSEEWGQTIPAVLEPFGMNFWTPQTRATERKCVAPFYYNDTLFQGFRNSHWLVGGCTQDYGSFTLAAVCGTLRTQPEQWATRFSHDNEVSHPYYYAVSLPDEELYAEMTGTARAAIFRFSSLTSSAANPQTNLASSHPHTPAPSRKIYLILQPNSDEGEGRVSIDLKNRLLTADNPVHRIYQGWGESAGFAGHYALQYRGEPVEFGVFDANRVYPGESSIAMKEGVGAYLCFEIPADESLLVKAGSSFTDVRGAVCNLQAEIAHWDFESVCQQLKTLWVKRLSLMEAESSDTALLHKFYGAFYRASFLPHAISDADGRYPAFAQGSASGSVCRNSIATKVLTLPPGQTHYGDYSMWDTYRAVHPLMNILTPTLNGEMMQSLVRMYEQGGWLPIFPCWNSYTAAMIGDHCSSVLADAWVKGVRNFDIETAYRAMRQNAFTSPKTYAEYKNGMGRRALKSYLRYGYIPLEDSVPEAFHQKEQVSRTLEYAYDDFCVAQVAKALGRENDYRELMRRSENWRNVFDPATGYVAPLPSPRRGEAPKGKSQGHSAVAASPLGGDGRGAPFKKQPYITEGAPCHYTWYVPQNPQGLMEAMGGKEPFVAKLDSMFTCGRYWHGNEPCHQVVYLFNVANEQWRTQKYVRHIIDTEYLDAPGGLSGNDDAGQMSAWLLFACMGFYPVCPATPYYYIGAPVFPRLTLHLENGRTFTIIAEGVSEENIYIQRMTLNGQPLTQPYLSHSAIMQGGELRCQMGSNPMK